MQGDVAQLCLQWRNSSAQAKERERAVAVCLYVLAVETCSGPSASFWQFCGGGGGCARSSQLPSTALCSTVPSLWSCSLCHRCWPIHFSANNHIPVGLLHQASGSWLTVTVPVPQDLAANGEEEEILVRWYRENGQNGRLAIILDILKTAFMLDLRYSLQLQSC